MRYGEHFFSGEVFLMFLQTKVVSAALLASTLLCTSPLAAALKTSGHARTAAPVSQLKATSSRTSSRGSGHKSTANAVSTRKGRGKIHIAMVSKAMVSKPKSHGQQSIGVDRTIEIQQALIREHYLDGEATGEWDQATRDALTRFQGDNHWQTKILPDSRALIKLGLGPSQQNLLNPESAAIAIPFKLGLEKSGSN
jgi:Putative peptidoglycan binding domain